MPIAEANGQRIYYEDVGEGTPIILGHSFLCTGDMWREQVPVLAENHRVINPDLRGHGQSGKATSPWSLEDALQDSIGLLDHLGIDRAIWCGLSIGGMVALRAALDAPERVSALILMDTDAGEEKFLRILKYRVMGVGANAFGVKPFVPAVLKLMFGVSTRRNNQELVKEYRGVFAGIDTESIVNSLPSLTKRVSVTSRLAEIKVPTVVIVGEEDKSLPVARSQLIHDRLADSDLVVIPEAGHLSAIEQPERVNDAVRAFLGRTSCAS